MPAITFPEYVQHITDLLNHAVAAGEAVLSTLPVDNGRPCVASFLEDYDLAMAQSYISASMLTQRRLSQKSCTLIIIRMLNTIRFSGMIMPHTGQHSHNESPDMHA
jgi:hypothetical protein